MKISKNETSFPLFGVFFSVWGGGKKTISIVKKKTFVMLWGKKEKTSERIETKKKNYRERKTDRSIFCHIPFWKLSY